MKNLIHKALLKGEHLIERFSGDDDHDPSDIVIENYDGYANDETVILRGRVLSDRKAWEFTEADSGWRNFRGIAQYWLTDEIAGAGIEGEIGGVSFSTKSDEEGYYRIEIARPPNLKVEGRWASCDTWIAGQKKRFTGLVQVVPAGAERIIISDIDDTVIETGARQILQMVKTTLLKNMHTRKVFEGVSEFYTDLLNKGQNPLYYVTSSPWNLRPFLRQVFDLRGIPRGPAFMTDWGLDETKFFKDGHGTHKLEAIAGLLDFHQSLPCILIGDSGEQDPEIYSGIVEKFPGRVEAIYIRDVAEDARDEAVRTLAKLCEERGVPLLLVADSHEAAEDARERGFTGN